MATEGPGSAEITLLSTFRRELTRIDVLINKALEADKFNLHIIRDYIEERINGIVAQIK